MKRMLWERVRGAKSDGTESDGTELDGTESNGRLTALSGMVLFVLLAALGLTIVGIHRLIGAHAFLGMLLLGPLVVKLGSTGWRFFRYYTGDPAYGRAGPPQPILRVLAPLVVLTTLAVFGTGVALLWAKPGRGSTLVFLHKASFILWFGLMTIHVLAYLPRALSRSLSDLTGRGPAAVLQRRTWRLGGLGVSLVVGLALGVAGLSWIHPWAHWMAAGHGGDH
jgi:hypothetical protein